jgi:hypothetical protein
VIYGPDEIVQVVRGRLGGRPNVVGDHVDCGSHGWGIVMAVSPKHRGMLVQLAKKGPYLDRQEFPEWDLMQRAADLLARNIATGRTRG